MFHSDLLRIEGFPGPKGDQVTRRLVVIHGSCVYSLVPGPKSRVTMVKDVLNPVQGIHRAQSISVVVLVPGPSDEPTTSGPEYISQNHS